MDAIFYKNGEIEWIFTRIKKKRARIKMFFWQIVGGNVFEIFAPFPLLPPRQQFSTVRQMYM